MWREHPCTARCTSWLHLELQQCCSNAAKSADSQRRWTQSSFARRRKLAWLLPSHLPYHARTKHEQAIATLTDAKYIRVHGAAEHILKSVDVDIPRDQLVVMTGVSGSG